MFLRKVKLVMTFVAVVAALAAGAVTLAQSGIGKPKDDSGKPQHAGSTSWTYHILVSRNGEPPRKVAVVEMTGDTPIRVDAPGALILFQPKRDGEPDRQTATRSENVQENRKIVLTSLKAMDAAISQRYVCQIQSQRHINVRASKNGHLTEIGVREGQAVKKGDLMFKIAPTVNQAKLDAELAELQIAQLEFNNVKKLSEQKTVSQNEVALHGAKLAKAQANANLAKAELNSTNVVAPFDGIIDRLHEQVGSFVKEGDILTTLSDNSVMRVYFNVPENQYLEYMSNK